MMPTYNSTFGLHPLRRNASPPHPFPKLPMYSQINIEEYEKLTKKMNRIMITGKKQALFFKSVDYGTVELSWYFGTDEI